MNIFIYVCSNDESTNYSIKNVYFPFHVLQVDIQALQCNRNQIKAGKCVLLC